MKPILWTLGLSLSLVACLGKNEPETHSQDPVLELSGHFESHGGDAVVYLGESHEPLAQLHGGTFELKIPNSAIQAVADRRLYFYNSAGDAATYIDISRWDHGRRELGTLVLEPEVEMSGQVKDPGEQLPLEGVTIALGRATAVSDANGYFSIKAPRHTPLTITLVKQGYVQTQAYWDTGAVDVVRDFPMYSAYKPEGTLSLPPNFRSTLGPVSVQTAATSAATLIRVSSEPFTVSAMEDSTWMDIRNPLSLTQQQLSKGVLYYQFADSSRTQLGSIQVLNLP